MKLVMARSIGYETVIPLILGLLHAKAPSHLSSGPPSFLTIFLREKIVPKTSFASSSALNALACGWPSENPLAWGPLEIGRGIHFFL